MELQVVCARTDGTTEGRYLAVLSILFNTDPTSVQIDLVGTVNEQYAAAKNSVVDAKKTRVLAETTDGVSV